MGHGTFGRGTFIHAKTTSNVYSSFPPVSQQYRIIEEHPEESIITSQIQSLHILVGCKLSSVADAYTITVNLLIDDNQIPTIPTIPNPNIISQAAPHHDEPAGRLSISLFEVLLTLQPLTSPHIQYTWNQLGGSLHHIIVLYILNQL